jgi:hypothetical protein
MPRLTSLITESLKLQLLSNFKARVDGADPFKSFDCHFLSRRISDQSVRDICSAGQHRCCSSYPTSNVQTGIDLPRVLLDALGKPE